MERLRSGIPHLVLIVLAARGEQRNDPANPLHPGQEDFVTLEPSGSRTWSAVALVGVLLAMLLLPGCEPVIAVTLRSTEAVCANQRAAIPQSRKLTLAVNASPQRVDSAVSVSLLVHTEDVMLYLSFAPGFPAEPTTAEARASLEYGYTQVDYRQPSDIGGSLTLLPSSVLFSLADFERFDVQGGALVWRLMRTSAEGYSKELSIYDEDKTNDPVPIDSCLTDDVVGMCQCEFSGPPVQVTLEGSIPLFRARD